MLTWAAVRTIAVAPHTVKVDIDGLKFPKIMVIRPSSCKPETNGSGNARLISVLPNMTLP